MNERNRVTMNFKSLARARWTRGLGALGLVLASVSLAHAQSATDVAGGASNTFESAKAESNKQGTNVFGATRPQGAAKSLMSQVGVEQNLDAQVPLQLRFKDESGKEIALGDYFRGKPVMLTMLQLTCDQICSAQFQVMANSLNDLKFTAGQEFEIVTVSIDPRESPLIAQGAKEEQLKLYEREGAAKGWHFLTGDKKNTKALAEALGIKYVWDEASKQYVHPDGIVIATPEGKISRYFLQLDYPARHLQFGLMDASQQKIGSFVDRLALSCFHYNPTTGKYSFQINAFLRIAALAFVFGGLAAIGLMLVAEKRRGSQDSDGKTPKSNTPGDDGSSNPKSKKGRRAATV